MTSGSSWLIAAYTTVQVVSRHAVRLGATAARIKEELGGGISAWIGGMLEPLIVGREQLSAAEFDREVAAGRVRDIETAIEEALATPVPTIVPSR